MENENATRDRKVGFRPFNVNNIFRDMCRRGALKVENENATHACGFMGGFKSTRTAPSRH